MTQFLKTHLSMNRGAQIFWGGVVFNRKDPIFARVDPLTSILAVLARSCQILTTSCTHGNILIKILLR